MIADRHPAAQASIASLARKLGFVNEAQVRVAREAGGDLLESLIAAGALTGGQLEVCRKAHDFAVFRDADLREAEPIVRANGVAADAVRRMLAYQKERFLRAGERLGLIDLLRREHLLPDDAPPPRPSTSPAAVGAVSSSVVSTNRAEPLIEVAEDEMSARALRPPNGSLTLSGLEQALARHGVVYGVADEALLRAWCGGAEPHCVVHCVVARGDPPEAPIHGRIEYLFDADPLSLGAARADGTIDFADRGEVPQCRSWRSAR